ncbi:MAG: ZIP family metal transporter [Candidatus Bathyarchaeia archaeon]
MLDPQAVVLSVLASMTTSLGAALVFLVKKTSHRTRDALVGLSAGLMLSVTALNLLPKALGPNDQNLLQVVIGIALGATALFIADTYMPHIHGFLAPDRPLTKGMKTTLMLVTALVIHNFPEGFATGTAYAGGVTVFGNTVALGIALQNVPEGFLVSVPLKSQGYSTRGSFIVGALSGFIEPVCSITALVVVGLFQMLLPYALAFAAGAMLYVIFDEMVPESHSHGFERAATASFMIGFILMTVLNYLALVVFA